MIAEKKNKMKRRRAGLLRKNGVVKAFQLCQLNSKLPHLEEVIKKAYKNELRATYEAESMVLHNQWLINELRTEILRR